MGKLDNRVAIVTGASSGVGKGVAKALARNGAKVCLLYTSHSHCAAAHSPLTRR